jgi:hypothetical protein
MKVSTLIVALLFLDACSGSGAGTTPGVKYDRYVLTESEIGQTDAATAYELVQLKRPEFFRPQVPKITGGAAIPIVYVDGNQYGVPDDLVKIPGHVVKEVRYLKPVDANLRYGAGHAGGAILVTTKR